MTPWFTIIGYCRDYISLMQGQLLEQDPTTTASSAKPNRFAREDTTSNTGVEGFDVHSSLQSKSGRASGQIKRERRLSLLSPSPERCQGDKGLM